MKNLPHPRITVAVRDLLPPERLNCSCTRWCTKLVAKLMAAGAATMGWLLYKIFVGRDDDDGERR